MKNALIHGLTPMSVGTGVDYNLACDIRAKDRGDPGEHLFAIDIWRNSII